MAGTLRIAILANAAKARAELDSVTARSSKMKDAFKVGAAAAGVAVAGFAVNAVKSATDLNETLNKSSAIFGANAKGIEQWAAGASKSVGLSKQAALDSAASFGDMFSQIGFTGQAAADMSKATVQMAADFGSFNNLPTADVADRISAAYRGEFDSLQAIVPNINAARVEQEAMALSHKKTAKELTAQDKALAVNAILTKDGARAVGDFAKTSEGAANKQKTLKADFDNLSATVGTKLIPALNLGLQAVSKVMTILSNPAVQVAAVAIAALAVGVYAVNAAARAYTATQAALNIVMALNPIGLVVLAIVALVAILVIAYKKSATFRGAVQAVWNTIRSAWGAIPGFVSGIVNKVGAFFTGLKTKTLGVFSSAGGWLKSAGSNLVQGFKDGIAGAWGRFTGWIEAQVNRIPLAVRKALGIASPSKVMKRDGIWTGRGYVDGLKASFGKAQGVVSGIVGGLSAEARIGGTVAVAGAAGGASQPLVLEFHATGDPLMDAVFEAIRKQIRVKGGNVQKVLGVTR